MAVDVQESLTRKLGPLPTWAWGVVVAGGVLVARKVGFGGGGGGASQNPVVINPPVSPTTPDAGEGTSGDAAIQSQISDLSDQLTAMSTAYQASDQNLASQLAGLADTVTGTASSAIVTKIRDLMVQLNAALFQREQLLHEFDYAKAQAYNNYRAYADFGGSGGGNVKAGTSATNKAKALAAWNEYIRLQKVATDAGASVATVNTQIADLQAQLASAA